MSLRVVYGGTFDPIHHGHLALACHVRDRLDAEIVWLPSARPPHRARPGASDAQRVAMLHLALHDQARMRVDDRECRRLGPSFSVDTLRELRQEWGEDAPIAWMIGADAFAGLASWREWWSLLDLAHWVVMSRPGHDLHALPEELQAACAPRWTEQPQDLRHRPAGCLLRIEGLEFLHSASAVRAAVAADQDIRDLVPASVADYIQRQGLYRPPGGEPTPPAL